MINEDYRYNLCCGHGDCIANGTFDEMRMLGNFYQRQEAHGNVESQGPYWIEDVERHNRIVWNFKWR